MDKMIEKVVDTPKGPIRIRHRDPEPFMELLHYIGPIAGKMFDVAHLLTQKEQEDFMFHWRAMQDVLIGPMTGTPVNTYTQTT